MEVRHVDVLPGHRTRPLLTLELGHQFLDFELEMYPLPLGPLRVTPQPGNFETELFPVPGRTAADETCNHGAQSNGQNKR